MSDADHREFGQLLDAWAAAIVANDPDAIGAFAEPDWLLIGEYGISSRPQFLESVATGQVTHDAMSFDIHEVRVYGDVALVVARAQNSGTYEGTRFDIDESTTDVYIRRDGGWRCALTHVASAADRPERERSDSDGSQA